MTLKWKHVGQREMATKLVSILTSFACRVLFKEHLQCIKVGVHPIFSEILRGLKKG